MLSIKRIRLFSCLLLSMLFFSTYSAYSVNFHQKKFPVENSITTKSKANIVILVSYSLHSLIEPLLETYAVNNNITISVIYTSTPFAFKQLELGSPADIAILNDNNKMKRLSELGWFSSVDELWQNRLALISAPKKAEIGRFSFTNVLKSKNTKSDNLLTTNALSDVNFFSFDNQLSWDNYLKLSDNSSRHIGVCDPLTCQLGQFTLETINQLDFSPKINQKVIYLSDSKTIMNQIQNNKIDYAFTYYSDALNGFSENIISIVPESMHQPIIYTMGVVNQKNLSKAKKEVVEDFSLYLKSIPVSMAMLDKGLSLPSVPIMFDEDLLLNPSINILINEPSPIEIDNPNSNILLIPKKDTALDKEPLLQKQNANASPKLFKTEPDFLIKSVQADPSVQIAPLENNQINEKQ